MMNAPSQLNCINEKLEHVIKMQETYEKNFLNSKNKQEQSTASGDKFSAGGSQEQAEQLKEMGNLIASIKLAVNAMTEKIYQHERRIDSLEHYSRSNSLILHGCQDVPKNASNFEFDSYVCKKINSNLQLSQPLQNKDIDICHVLPSKKGKNPIIIKFIKRTIRNEIFFQKNF